MPWRPLPRIAFAVAIYPFQPATPSDLPLELGDELYIIEQGGINGDWYRGYLVAPPSLLAGLTSIKGQSLEARVFSGIFPRSCVEVREYLGDAPLPNGVSEEDESTADNPSDAAPDTTGDVAKTDGQPPTSNGTTAELVNGVKHGSIKRTRSERQRQAATLSRALSQRKSTRQKDRGPTKRTPRQSLQSPRSPATINAQFESLQTPPRDPNTPKPPAPVPMLKVGDETPTSAEEPLVDEIAACLREWHSTNLHELFLARRYSLLDQVARLVRRLDLARRQLLHEVLTVHGLNLVREKVVWDLVHGNKLLGAEVVVRDPARRGQILTGDDSAVEISSLQSTMSLLEQRPLQAPEPSALRHIYLNVSACSGSLTETAVLGLYLCSKPPGRPPTPLTETFAISLPPPGAADSVAHLTNVQTLFTDLHNSDIDDKADVFLVVKVMSQQLVQPAARTSSVARPPSRDDSVSGRSSSMSRPSAFGGSFKGGRRSFMWGPKSTGGSTWNKSFQSSSRSISSRDGAGSYSSPGPDGLAENGSQKRPTSRSSMQSQPNPIMIRRTTAAGVLLLDHASATDTINELDLELWATSSDVRDDQKQYRDWNERLTEMMEKRGEHHSDWNRVEALQLQMQSFVHADSEALIKETPTVLDNVSVTKKIDFSGAPQRTRSDIYLTLNEAFLPRNALISHSRAGTVSLNNNATFTNLIMTLEVRTSTGERIPNCIFPFSNQGGVSSWQSTAAERGDSWGQVIRLELAEHLVSDCHLFMLLGDVPGLPFAMSWMPLWEQQAFIRDGPHTLLLYHYDDHTATPGSTSFDKGGYMSLGWNASVKDDVAKDEAMSASISSLRLDTYICSTIFSQDLVLLGLLKWRERAPENVLEILRRVPFVPEIEIVKLLDEVLDALFAILVDQAGSDEYEDLVFGALVTVLSIVHDRRFNLAPKVDHYADQRFNYPFAAPCLVRSFTRLLSDPTNPESSRRLRATFKVGRHIFKFIIKARAQQKIKEAGIGITSSPPSFGRDLQSIFKNLESLMTTSAPVLIGSQTLAVQHFHTWLPELAGFLSLDDILKIASQFIDACAGVTGKLILHKLVLLIHLSRLDLFSPPEVRQALVTNTIRWLGPHWGTPEVVDHQWRDQVRLCCSVLSVQAEYLEAEASRHLPKIVASYRSLQALSRSPKDTFSLLFPKAYPFPSRSAAKRAVFDEAMIELAAILAIIARSSGGFQVSLQGEELSDFMFESLQVYLSILACDAFPSDWISVYIYHHQSAIRTLEYMGSILCEQFLPEPEDAESFNTELWRGFFTTLLKLVGSDALALETFPEQKRRAVWKIAGDVREQGAELLRRSWDAIGWDTSEEDRRRWGLSKMGGYQVQYVPGLVGPIVRLCLSIHGSLRNVAVQILHTMIVSEWTLSEDLSIIQVEIIDCLDQVFKSKRVNESVLQKLFVNEMMDLFEPLSRTPDEPLHLRVKELIATVDEFLGFLVAVHHSGMTGEASHIIHTLRLMEFLKDLQKEDIYIRYVHQLTEVQIKSRNFVEAGLALRLHAQMYDWDQMQTLPATEEPAYPQQTAFERKEQLYFQMIKQFEDGRAWANALASYRELADQYEKHAFDFTKLARTQRAMASIYEAIARGEWEPPRYFKVVYRGLGFPANLRDKEFIYEGVASERLASFTDRMQQQHPSAQFTQAGDTEDLEGQYLQITAVGTHRDLNHAIHQRSRVQQSIRDYLLLAQPSHFTTTLQRPTASQDVKEQSSAKVLHTTADTFPTILRRSEIVTTEEIHLTPTQTALERTHRKIQEFSAWIKLVEGGQQTVLVPLAEALRAALEPTSEHSVARYRELLPRDRDEVEDEVSTPVIQDPLEAALKMAMIDYTLVVKRGLATVTQAAPPQEKPELEELNRRFESIFTPELKALPSLMQPPPPPIPTARLSLSSRAPTSLQSPASIPPLTLPPLGPMTNKTFNRDARSPRHEKNRLSLGFVKQGTNDLADLLNGLTGSSQSHAPAATASTAAGAEKPRPVERIENTTRSKSGNRLSWRADSSSSADRSALPSRGSAVGGKSVRGTSQHDRPPTSSSATNTISQSVGSVKKRLSLLRMGAKGSHKGTVKVDSVLEE
ncbi:MAG: hypothetical protein M1817_002533 [Caeruleum heppii]|nr:MAG: hypothetical protein M1817_002533 [Caeruleum heppii]